jgi:RHS repeat-associated protein
MTRRATSRSSSESMIARSSYDALGLDPGRPLGFASDYTDAETGFVYLRARYYDPATGQFLSRDPLVALTGGPYAYADGYPLNYADPSGLVSWGSVSAVAILRSQHWLLVERRLSLEPPALAAPALVTVGVSAQTAVAIASRLQTASIVAGLTSTELSASATTLDCRHRVDINCWAGIAGTVGGAATNGVSFVAGATRPLISLVSNGLGFLFDALAFVDARGPAAAYISRGADCRV